MPKVVDHAERREQLADAVLAVIRRSGLARTTLREVAREVGWTSGVLLHYFRDKHELISFAFQLATRRAGARVRARLPGLSGVAGLRAYMEETLPVDESRHLDAAIWLSFEGEAAGVPRLAAEQRALYEDLHENLQRLVTAAQQEGDIPPHVDPDRAAGSVAATIIGMRTLALIHPDRFTPEFMLAVADDTIARLTAGGAT